MKSLSHLLILLFLGLSSIANAQWSCGDTLIDKRDGKAYATVQIANQCWLAQNLNHGKMIESTVGGHLMLDDSIIERYSYKNIDQNSDTSDHPGAYYEYTEAVQYKPFIGENIQGVCPDGWHIPTTMEFTELVEATGGDSIAGLLLRKGGNSGFESYYCGWRCMMGKGSFFTAYPSFSPPAPVSFYWTADTTGSKGNLMRLNAADNNVLITKSFGNMLGMNIRCILDKSQKIKTLNLNIKKASFCDKGINMKVISNFSGNFRLQIINQNTDIIYDQTIMIKNAKQKVIIDLKEQIAMGELFISLSNQRYFSSIKLTK